MVWSGIIVVWFKGTVDVEVHLDLLQNMIRAFLDAVQHGNSIDTMQHDGAPCLVARPWLDILQTKFENYVLVRNLERNRLANSPGLTLIDFSFSNQVNSYLKEIKPESLEDLKRAVEDFVATL